MAEILTPKRQYVGSAKPAVLIAPVDSSSVAPIQCDALSGWPSGIGYDEFVATLGRGTTTEERILCTSTSGNTIIVKTRGWDDTLAVSHDIGETVEHTYSSTDAQDANDHIVSTAAHGSDGAIVGEARLSQALLETDLIPPGSMSPYGGVAAPEGWVLCDGQTLSATRYPKLYAVFGTRFGSGGAGTFKVPDLRGRTVLGVSTAHVIASTGGSETAVLAEANLPQHGHAYGSHSHTFPGHGHTGTADGDGTHSHTISSHQHALSTDQQGSHNHFLPWTGSRTGQQTPDIPHIASGGVNSGIATNDGSGVHWHNGSTDWQRPSVESGTAHNHALTIAASGSGQTADGGSGSTGGGNGTAAAFAVMQPFMALLWIVKVDAVPVN